MLIWYLIYLWTLQVINIKPQRRIQRRRTGREPPPPPCKLLRMYFWNFRLQNTHKLYCNQYAMFYNMYFILYSHYKSIEYVWRGIKTISRPKKLYRNGTAPPALKFLDPPLNHIFSVVDTLDLWMKCIIYVRSGSVEILSVALTQTSCTINYSGLWEVWNF